jgi:hypothetical protein
VSPRAPLALARGKTRGAAVRGRPPADELRLGSHRAGVRPPVAPPPRGLLAPTHGGGAACILLRVERRLVMHEAIATGLGGGPLRPRSRAVLADEAGKHDGE